MRLSRVPVVVLGLVVLFAAQASPPAPMEPARGRMQPPRDRAPCTVSIRYIKKSGLIEERLMPVMAASKEECERAAEDHRTNFTPDLVTKKEVKAFWAPSLSQ